MSTEPFIGQIALFSGSIPRGWIECKGQLLDIRSNQALFSLLGTKFGGNGMTNFALPNLQGRVPLGQSESEKIGSTGGTEKVALAESNLPAHAHSLIGTCLPGTAAEPGDALPAAPPQGSKGRSFVEGSQDDLSLSTQSISRSGQSKPHNNIQPSLALLYAIALQGIYPSQY